MATITIEERPGRRSGAWDSSFTSSYSRSFFAHIAPGDDVETGPMAIKAALAAEGITIGTVYAVGEPSDPFYEVDYGASVRNIRIKEGDDPAHWEIDVDYGPWEPKEANPIDEPVRFGLAWESVEAPADIDALGNPIVNTAGDPFNPSPTKVKRRPVLTFSRNEVASSDGQPDYGLIDYFADTVNVATWNGFPPKSVRFDPPILRRMWHPQVLADYPTSNGWYFEVEYRFAVARELWKTKLLNQGFRYKSGGVLRAATDSSGLPVQDPVLLAADGSQTTTAHYLEFELQETRPFADLGLI